MIGKLIMVPKLDITSTIYSMQWVTRHPIQAWVGIILPPFPLTLSHICSWSHPILVGRIKRAHSCFSEEKVCTIVKGRVLLSLDSSPRWLVARGLACWQWKRGCGSWRIYPPSIMKVSISQTIVINNSDNAKKVNIFVCHFSQFCPHFSSILTFFQEESLSLSCRKDKVSICNRATSLSTSTVLPRRPQRCHMLELLSLVPPLFSI